MFTIGDKTKTIIVNSGRNAIEFERYCKGEGLNSIQLRREIYKSSRYKKIRLLKNIIILVKKIF